MTVPVEEPPRAKQKLEHAPTAPDGSSVEKALIKSGETRSFSPGQVGRMVLGNASAVEVQQAGTIVDLSPYQRANVARFTVSSDGSVAPVSH